MFITLPHQMGINIFFENTRTCCLCSPVNLNNNFDDPIFDEKTDFALKLENIAMKRGLECIH